MKAMQFGETDVLVLNPAELPMPVPGPGEILIQVAAAGVIPTEKSWYPTTHKADGSPRTHAIPGHEFSGTVAALGPGPGSGAGPGADSFPVGAAVYGMNDWFAEGATAEYCLTKPEWVASKPPALSDVVAASAPVSALTAWQGLVERARLQPGEKVLVHGGAGAVGLFAVQIARLHGATVLTTAAADTFSLLRGLGASHTIDYRTQRFEDAAGMVDVIFDTVGGDTLQRSWDLLKPGGRMITIAAEGEHADEPRLKEAFFIVVPNGQQLAHIGKLLSDGSLKTFVKAVVPLQRANEAYEGVVQGMAREGKLVIAVGSGPLF